MATIANHGLELWMALAVAAPFIMARIALGGKK